MSFWRRMDDDEKMDYILGRADYDIVDWHHDIMEKRRKSAFTFAIWKELARVEFGQKQSQLGDIYRLKQKEDEKVCDFIIRVKKEAKSVSIDIKEQVDIVIAGLKDGLYGVKSYILGNQNLNEDFFERIKELEELAETEARKMAEMKSMIKKLEYLQIKKPLDVPFLCYSCKKEGHMSKNCPMRKKSNSRKANGVYEVNEEDELEDILKIRDTLVYINN